MTGLTVMIGLTMTGLKAEDKKTVCGVNECMSLYIQVKMDIYEM